MGMSSPVYPLAVAALCLALAALIARGSAWYRGLLAQTQRERFEAIDGLRGYLALGVFFTHVATTREWYASGHWDSSAVAFCSVAGQAGVSLFFIVTAFLFWSRVLDTRALEPRPLYRSRIRRLVPMYLASVALSLFVIGAMTGLRFNEAPLQVAREVRAWLSFGFMENGPVNGLREAHLVAPIYWTLAFEWSFYLALPLLALFARGKSFLLLVALAVFFGVREPITLNFVGGALVAVAARRKWLDARMASPWAVPVPLAAIAGVLAMPTAYAPLAVLLMTVFFAFVAAGNPLLGLLTLRASKLLGMASYSFYLLHGTVLFVAFRTVDALRPVASLTPAEHWAVATGAALATVALSVFTYRHIEHRFLVPSSSAPAPALGLGPRAAARAP